jgi:suppressor for copper-sensitivity B
MCRMKTLLALLASALFGAVAPAIAAPASDWQRTREVDYRLVSSVEATGTLETIRMGVEFDLEPGWHIYWRSPGDAGFPPEIRFEGAGVAGGDFRWPRPERFLLLDIETVGYEGRVILPLDIRVSEPGRPLAVDAALSFLICKEICIPADGRLALDLPAGDAAPSEFAHEIDRFDGLVPQQGAWPGLELDAPRLLAPAEAGKPASLQVAVASSEPLSGPDLLVEATPDFWFGRPEVRQEGTRTIFTVPVTGPAGNTPALFGQDLVLTLLEEGGMAAELRTTAPAGFDTAGDGPGGSAAGIGLILAFAFLGGLILNLMPCVLPVLSMKLVAFACYGGAERAMVRRGFLAAAAGIVATIMTLAGGAIALKAAGAAVGWGIQFQQPLFLVFMAAVIVLFALNLFGRFEFRLPGAVTEAAASPAPKGAAGHFLTGIFATLLATPCSAPFLGTAVGFALAGTSGDIIAVFLSIGLGLAAPYLAVAALPGLATLLPKPGRWMIRLKQVLGVALLATAAWLLSVLLAQTGWVATGLVAASLVLMALAVAVRPRLTLPAAAAGLAVSMAFAGFIAAPPADSNLAGSGAIRWEPFDRAAIDAHVAAGRTVLVDVTADWCVTCQVNKKLVIDRGRVAGILDDGRVVAMRADWTRPDAAIAAYLASFGRYGIPFNAVYGPAAPDGIALPELLSEAAVLAAFGTASAGAVVASR